MNNATGPQFVVTLKPSKVRNMELIRAQGALKQRAYRAAKRGKKSLHAQNILAAFPIKNLRMLKPSALGQTNEDYGNASFSLNFCARDVRVEVSGSVGRLSIGWMYEADQKMVANSGRTRCLASAKHIEYLKAVRDSLEEQVEPKMLIIGSGQNHSVMDTMRVTAIRGARTRPHTDSLRSNTCSYVMFHASHGSIRIRQFPHFRTSVVLLQGKPYIPVALSSSHGLQMYGFSKNGKCASKYEFPYEALNMLQPYGNIDVAVVGIKSGALQVFLMDDGPTVYRSPNDLPTTTMAAIMTKAGEPKNSVFETPNPMWKKVYRPHVWHKFESWRFIHCWSLTGNCLVPRTHVFFRALRQVPTSASYIRHGRNKNCETLSMSDIEHPDWHGSLHTPVNLYLP